MIINPRELLQPKGDLSLKTPSAELRLLQLAVFLAAGIAVTSGAGGILRGPAFFGLSGDITGDSHARYFSGLLLGVGLAFWSTIPRIEKDGYLLRALSFAVLCGGASRLWAMIAVGVPHDVAWFALINETFVPIALCVWQSRVSREVKSAASLLSL